jgi:hypothetical protein
MTQQQTIAAGQHHDTTGGQVAVNKCLRLAVFGLAWAMLNVALVDCGFELAFKRSPYHIAQVLMPAR